MLVETIEKAADLHPQVAIDPYLLFEIVNYCLDAGVEGHRGDIIILKTAKTPATHNGRARVIGEDIDATAELVLPNRIRRQSLRDIVVDVVAVSIHLAEKRATRLGTQTS